MRRNVRLQHRVSRLLPAANRVCRSPCRALLPRQGVLPSQHVLLLKVLQFLHVLVLELLLRQCRALLSSCGALLLHVLLLRVLRGRRYVLLPLVLLQRGPPVVRLLMQGMVAVLLLPSPQPLLLPLADRSHGASRRCADACVVQQSVADCKLVYVSCADAGARAATADAGNAIDRPSKQHYQQQVSEYPGGGESTWLLSPVPPRNGTTAPKSTPPRARHDTKQAGQHTMAHSAARGHACIICGQQQHKHEEWCAHRCMPLLPPRRRMYTLSPFRESCLGKLVACVMGSSPLERERNMLPGCQMPPLNRLSAVGAQPPAAKSAGSGPRVELHQLVCINSRIKRELRHLSDGLRAELSGALVGAACKPGPAFGTATVCFPTHIRPRTGAQQQAAL